MGRRTDSTLRTLLLLSEQKYTSEVMLSYLYRVARIAAPPPFLVGPFAGTRFTSSWTGHRRHPAVCLLQHHIVLVRVICVHHGLTYDVCVRLGVRMEVVSY